MLHRRETAPNHDQGRSLARAKDVARDWYLGLLGKYRAGELKEGVTFRKAADQFLTECEALMRDERNPFYVRDHRWRLRVHLLPFFGDKVVAEITPGTVQEYRIHRMTSRTDPKTREVLRDPKTGEPLKDPKTGWILKDPKTGVPKRPSRSTLHQEIITLRQVLKTANRNGWLPYLPDLSAPYKTSGKISHRAWFSREEYKQLYEAARERAKNPPRPRYAWAYAQLLDFILFMVNTGLRPDEAWRLEFRDVEVVKDADSGETILEISVRGKRGTGYCKSMPGAVQPFQRLRKRPRPAGLGRHLSDPAKGKDGQGGATPSAARLPDPTDLLFPDSHRQLLNTILAEESLKTDREGNARTAYSLRHTYICLRLMEGADIYQIAKNCRTSVEMIEKFYASHIKNMIDASAVNVRRSKRSDDRAPKRAADAKRPRTNVSREPQPDGGGSSRAANAIRART